MIDQQPRQTITPHAEPEPAIDDCWTRIGVQGDRSCPELARHTHCRNSQRYCAAGRKLLDEPVSGADCDFWTHYYAQSPQQAQQQLQSFTFFQVCNERFAIATLCCARVANMRPVHRLPHRSSSAILGIANIHGELIVCVSFAALLSLQASDATTGTQEGKLLLTRWRDGPVAFVVDAVESVQKIATSQLQSLPATIAQTKTRFTKAILARGETSVGVLDEALLEAAVRHHLA